VLLIDKIVHRFVVKLYIHYVNTNTLTYISKRLLFPVNYLLLLIVKDRIFTLRCYRYMEHVIRFNALNLQLL